MRTLLFFVCLFVCFSVFGQQGMWQAQLHRDDGNNIVFSFEWKKENDKNVWYIRNSTERIRVPDITVSGDSMVIQMPVFESQFRVKYANNRVEGVWLKGSPGSIVKMPFTAQPGTQRFPVGNPKGKDVSGRWAVSFNNGTTNEKSVAELKQKGNIVTGTIINATGDDRFLEGVVNNDSLYLSTFDGSHAYLFIAKLNGSQDLDGGWYYSGATFKQEWSADRNENAKVSSESTAMFLKPGEERLNFSFKDLDGKSVSINDERFKNKVVVVQLMGSWCPNCMDETIFLSDYYSKNKNRGVEIVSLAYEYSTDFDRSVKTLRKFQTSFKVQYPMLITGVAVNDSLRTEKTLPQLTEIKFFPSSIIIDKKGKVRKIDTEFNGPGTGEHYIAYKKSFEDMIDGLLKEN